MERKLAKCKLCKKVIQLSNMGECSLILHTGGDKHKQKLQIQKRPKDHIQQINIKGIVRNIFHNNNN